MTKHTDEFLQFAEPVTVVSTLLPRDEQSTDPKCWIRGNTKIGPVLEVTTSYLQGKYGVEIRIESVKKDNSHSWVRLSHGLNKLVTDLIDKDFDDDEQETSTTKKEVFAIASRSKAKAKPRRPSTTCSSSRILPILERTWIDIKPGARFDQAYPVVKRINTLLRHGELPREEDSAIESWRLKDDLRKRFEHSQDWSDDVWKNKMQEATIKDFNTVLTGQDKKFFTFELFKVIQDAIPLILHCRTMYLIPNNFFEYIHHIGCAVNLHSITNSGLTAGGQNSIRDRQTVFFTAVKPMHKKHQNPKELDLTKPRLASYKQKWKVHQDTVYRVDIQLAQRQGLKFYQTRSNAVIFYDTLTAYCIWKAIAMKSEEKHTRKRMCHLPPPPTIYYKDNWTCDLDSDVARSSKDIQRIELKSNTQSSSQYRETCL